MLALPVPFRRDAAGRLCLERQACNGLELWARHFSTLVVACPMDRRAVETVRETGADYLPVTEIPSHQRIEFLPLPWAYEIGSFLRHYAGVRQLLADRIAASEYLSFAIGGLIGDWPSVAALEAIRQQRPYSVWTDRVEHQVIKREHLNQRGVKRVYRQLRNYGLFAPLMRHLERHVIKHAELGLFHGRDTYDTYAPWCRAPYLVHNIHLKPADRIDATQLAHKLERAHSGEPLRLIYSGRVAAMKGPQDWLRVMAELRARGVAFTAEWLGDGPLFDELKRAVVRLGLADQIQLPGHIADQATLLRKLKDADLFVFCHKTLESPRCLIEALMTGSPLVGYDSAYPRDLLEREAESLLTPADDTLRLAERIAALNGDRSRLAQHIEHAAALGSRYSDADVFAHRSALIKGHLGQGNTGQPGTGVDHHRPVIADRPT